MEGLSARAKRFNVFVNAIGTMLVYTSFFAGTMLLVSSSLASRESLQIFIYVNFIITEFESEFESDF